MGTSIIMTGTPKRDGCAGSGHIRKVGNTPRPCAQGVGGGSDSCTGPFWIQHQVHAFPALSQRAGGHLVGASVSGATALVTAPLPQTAHPHPLVQMWTPVSVVAFSLSKVFGLEPESPLTSGGSGDSLQPP